MTLIRRLSLTLGLLAALTCLLSACGRSAEPAAAAGSAQAAPAHELPKIKFQLDWYPAPEHGGFYEASVEGYYRAQGIDVNVLSGGPGAYTVQNVAMGNSEFAMGGAADVIRAIKEGLPLLIVGVYMQHDPQGIMVHAEGNIHTFKDLDKKSVMFVPGANWAAYLQAHYGITINCVPVDYGLARFMSDKEAIQQCFISNEPYHVQLQGHKTREMLIADGGYDPYRVVFTKKAYARAHPEVVRAFVAGSIRGWNDFLFGDSTRARAAIQSDNPSQVTPLIDYSIAAMKRYNIITGDPAKGERTGMMKASRLKSLMDILVELKSLDTPLPMAQIADFQFLPAEENGINQ